MSSTSGKGISKRGSLKGAFPGGPTRRQPDDRPRKHHHIARLEDVYTNSASRQMRQSQGRKRRRALAGMVVAVIVAIGAGVYSGFSSHRSLQDVRAEQQVDALAAAEPDSDMQVLTSEVNRTLLELWKMEEAEFARNSGR